ncbi:MAG: hypothetical protein WBL02_03795 [Methanomethylovorans sp.]|uniref:hypothetical protein n=1 Tax=Methanomethylovorans sp. TaxID=2758717 RepID=UPI000B08014A|nr:hypothetical protein [Methanomethylovorans sp.]
MRYTYQDSTDLPIQRDFIQDIKDLIEIASKALSLENDAIEVNEIDMRDISSLENRIIELENFANDVKTYVRSISFNVDNVEILDCHNAIMDACDTSVGIGLHDLNKELDQKKREHELHINELEKKMFPTLNPLFEDGIYGAIKTYSVRFDNGSMKGELKASIYGVEYESEILYKNGPLLMREVYGNIQLPVWAKTGIIHKENKIRMIDVSDFMITNIDLNGDSHLELTFWNKKQDQQFKIMFNPQAIQIFHGNNDITADKILSQSIEIDRVRSLGLEINRFLEMSIMSQQLKKVMLDGKDAVRNNEVFDCFKIIMERYGDIVRECTDRGIVKNEITIKVERTDGTRTEKYVAKEELFNKLAELGSEGLELASILNVE